MVSTWLDRLRSSRGFPIATDLDLDHFLSSSDPIPTPNPSPKTHPSPAPTAAGDENGVMLDLMSSVLAELFVMGGRRENLPERNKVSRKQSNPRLCSLPAQASAGTAASPLPSADNSVVGAKKATAKPKRKKRGGGNLAGADAGVYTRTEVTVIDTSFLPEWKCEKIIFRNGAVWKVRDKKLWIVSRKKRKLGLVDKLASEKAKEQPLVAKKALARKENSASLGEEGGHTNLRDASKESQAPIGFSRRRLKFARSPRVPTANDSSTFRIQVLASSRRSGSSGPRSTVKRK